MRFLLVLCITAAGLPAVTAAAADPRPNILFCCADDWGWPHAGAYGDRVVQTPTFDRLAREGVLFEHAFVSSPSCTPSRNAVLTGQQFYRLGQGANLHSTLDVAHPNFMTRMGQAGYQIGHWRKAWGPGKYEPGGYAEHPCGPNVAFDKFMERRSDDQPFCFWFGTSDPHRPYEAGSGPASGVDLSQIHVPEFYPDTEVVRSDIADYYFEVQRWDRDVAGAIEQLERAGELENTIIVMSGDHGMPFPRCKGNLYDWGARVPLAVRWGAKIQGGRKVSDFVSLTDLAPTFLQAAGVDVPEAMSGQSLMDVLTSGSSGRVDPARDAVMFGRERHVPAQEMPSLAGYPARAVRTGQYLYVINLAPDRWPAGVPDGATHPMNSYADCDDGPTKAFLIEHRDDPQYRRFHDLCFAPREAEELYDVQSDPAQVNNLAGDAQYQQTLQELHGRLVSYLQMTDDPRFSGEPVEFDLYPYRTEYHRRRMEEWKQQQQSPEEGR